MLARKHKLAPATLFAKSHSIARGRHLMIAYAPASGTEGAFAVIVSAKVAPGSVQRHRIKRILFDAVAAAKSKGFDAVISVRSLPKEETESILVNETSELMRSIHIS